MIIHLFGVMLTSSYSKGNYFKTQWLSNIKNKKYDYIIVGNSRVTTISATKIDQEINKNGLNLGMENTTFSTFYLMLHLFFKNKNKSDYIFLEFDHYNYHNFKDTNKSHLFIPQIKDSEVFSVLRDLDSKYNAIRLFPFLGYGFYNFDWGLHNFFNQKFKLLEFPYLKNGDLISYKNDLYKDRGRKSNYNYSSDINKYFLKIKKLCEINNSKLITFTAPFFDKNNVKVEGKNIKTILDEEHINYYDFSSLYFLRKDLFFDNNHINEKGTYLFSKELSKLIK